MSDASNISSNTCNITCNLAPACLYHVVACGRITPDAHSGNTRANAMPLMSHILNQRLTIS